MPLVHLVSSGHIGGAERVMLEIVAALRQSDPSAGVRVIVPHDGPVAVRVRELGVPCAVVPFPRRFARTGELGSAGQGRLVLKLFAAAPGLAACFLRLRHVLARAGTDRRSVVHAHGFKMLVLAALAAPRGARVIWHVHDYVSGRRVSAALLRMLSRRCAAIVANSRSVAEDVIHTCGITRVVSIENAVDLDRFSPAGHQLDLDAAGGAGRAPGGTVRVGLVAMFGRWKGHEIFLRAVARLPGEMQVRAYVVGGASYETAGSQTHEAELRRIVAALDLQDRVVLTGPVQDVPAAMRALDVVVHASTSPEPFGMVIAEAMACGRAVVVSRAGGAAELVAAGADGLVHEPGDAAGLADALDQLIASRELRERLGRAARATAERRFDRARLLRELVPLYAGA